MQKSFIIVRPDGGQILDGIDTIIRKDGFTITDVYHLQNWDKLYLLLHQRELSDPRNVVSDNIKLNVWMSKQIYGNNGLIIQLIHDKYKTYEDLISKTYDLKFKVRDSFQNTRDGKFVIAINAELAQIELQHLKHNGKLIVLSDENSYIFSERMKAEGNYLPAYFNYIHCPDKGINEITSEYDIMKQNKILVKEKRLTRNQYNVCVRMHSCSRPW